MPSRDGPGGARAQSSARLPSAAPTDQVSYGDHPTPPPPADTWPRKPRPISVRLLAEVDDLTADAAEDEFDADHGIIQSDAEVMQSRPPNPIAPGWLPLAATTPVTFGHAAITIGPGATYPFLTMRPGATIARLDMQNASATKTIAATSRADSDHDGFTVKDGATAPAPPAS
jgi:hypothetical protein